MEYLPGPKMIFIAGGTFQMGQRGNIVTVADFWIDETPVIDASVFDTLLNYGCVER